MLPDAIRDLYVTETTSAFTRLEKNMERKTKHVAPVALEIAEPCDNSSLDDLRRVLLGWKTRVLELENAVSNGEMILQEMVAEMIHGHCASRYPLRGSTSTRALGMPYASPPRKPLRVR